jgi:peptidase M1-like protein
MKVRLLSAALACGVLLWQAGGRAAPGHLVQQADPGRDDARIRALVQQIEQTIRTGNPEIYSSVLSQTADRTRAENFLGVELRPGVTRVAIVERDRQHLIGTLPGTGYRIIVDAFIEYGSRARIATWQFDIKKIDDAEWRIADQERLSAVENLFKLGLTATRQFAAKSFTIKAEDLELTLAQGSVFTVDTPEGVTALVLLGQGDMRFEPTPETEKGQVQIFAGAKEIASRFDAAFVRVGELSLHASIDRLTARPVDPRELRRAEQVFREESGKTYALDLGDLTSETWSLLPPAGDFVAEMRTRRFGTLTYARSRGEPEDISVFDRQRQRNISAYASAERLATRGQFFDEDDLATYDVIDYDIDLTVQPTPDRQWLQGRARVRLQVRSPLLSQVLLRLANSLNVESIISEQYGRLFSLRVKNQNTVLVNLPAGLMRDTDLTLVITYSGRLAPQPPERETIDPQASSQRDSDPFGGRQMPDVFPIGERSYLYSSRSYWYPQPSVSDYATARLRIAVPMALACVASGELAADSPTIVRAPTPGAPMQKQYEFTADRPVRYLAFIVSRFVRAERLTVAFDESAGDGGGRAPSASPLSASTGPAMAGSFDTLNLIVEANPLQVARGRELADRAVDIAQFYQSILGDSPYPSFTLALVEHLQPGGHSPAYFAALNQPLPNTPLVWRTDPANFEGYPEFFLAHEMAHQWWGQAVGWRNYHEQWLSEGFAQYFAALYAERRYGGEVSGAMMRQLRKWAIDRSDQGPVYLGYRLGHIRNQPTVFRALVYNKGAAVLHMLRQLVGDDAFFRGLRRFYVGGRFLKVGTENFRAAMEAEAGQSLERFFTRWIYGSALPHLSFSYRVEAVGGRHEVVLRFDQEGDLFDVPVTVSLQFTDRRVTDVMVPVRDRTVEMRVPLEGTLRAAVINNDTGTLAEIRKPS